ncbi:MAG TPA: hypothetical protein H9769_04005 [Candidatus Microbacterium pullistercoris]|nr:hypothetical protein [Candidatus Microbacterium pullistercoris]
MTATLTERYIEATVRRLPATAQDDVRRELEASIADAVEARIEQGESPAEAEHAALTELGDPAVLASGFADRPLHLIGPRFYLSWMRLMKILLWTLPPLAAVGGAIGHAVTGAGFGTVFAEAIVLAISVAVHTAFWTTLIFAVIERTGAELPSMWTVDQLPEVPEKEGGWTDAIASLVFLALATGAFIWDALRGVVYAGDEWISVLGSGLWPWWMTALFAIMAAEAVFVVLRALRGRWTVGFAIGRTVLAGLFVSWTATVLGRDLLLNPEVVALLAERNVGGDVVAILAILLAASVAAGAVWSIIVAWSGARRDR